MLVIVDLSTSQNQTGEDISSLYSQLLVDKYGSESKISVSDIQTLISDISKCGETNHEEAVIPADESLKRSCQNSTSGECLVSDRFFFCLIFLPVSNAESFVSFRWITS